MSGKGFGRNYPKGRISGEDDGETAVAIAYDPENDRIIIRYAQPMKWVGLDAENAAQMIGLLHKHLQKMQIPIGAIQQSMIDGGAFSNQALTAAATTLVGASQQVNMPMMVRVFPEGSRGLAPGQSQHSTETKPHEDCLGIAIGVACSPDEAQELLELIDQWDSKRSKG